MNRTAITPARVRGVAAIIGLAIGASLILAGVTLALRGHADHGAHTGDLFMDPPIVDEPPRGDGIPRYPFVGFFFVLGAGTMAGHLLPALGWALAVAYGVGVLLAAAAVAVVLYRAGRRGGAR